MPLQITNVDYGSLIVSAENYQDELMAFTAAGTLAAGTILARDSISGNLVPFVIGGTTNDNGIPKAVLTEAVTATAAGNVPMRVLTRGVVRRDFLVVAADGNAGNITNAILDQLRDYGIYTEPVKELTIRDNQ